MSRAGGVRWLLVTLLLPLLVRAQETSIVHTVDEREAVVVRITPYAGASAVGGFGFVMVTAENRDASPHLCVIELSSHPWYRSSIGLHRELPLGPHELGRCFLPLPTTPDDDHRLDVFVDGVPYHGSSKAHGHAGVVGLLVSSRSDAEPWGLTVVQAMPASRPGKRPAEIVVVAPDDLPTDWRLFTGFHAVVVDGRARVSDAAQAALERFATSGGTVVVGDPDRLPAGPLRDRCLQTDADGIADCGLGRCVVVGTDGDTTPLRERLQQLERVDACGWPAPALLLREQQVPGLGEAPVVVFLVVILLFAFVVGPLNFLLLRRWRRPLLVLVTVPVCGLGTTLAMLGYGLVHDGLGVRGVVRSWTLLDQERHEATSLAMRTLFAGVSPDALTVAADGMLIAPRASLRPDRRSPDRWQFDPVTGRLDGGALPSRQSTPLLSARQGLARQRLRVRTADDGRLELLPDGGVVPVGEVLLRDADGAMWSGEAPFLSPAAERQATAALQRWQREAGAVTVRDDSEPPGEMVASLHAIVERLLGGGELARGSYVARVESAPWLDPHGLDVDYDRVEHFVFGRLAAEDFVR